MKNKYLLIVLFGLLIFGCSNNNDNSNVDDNQLSEENSALRIVESFLNALDQSDFEQAFSYCDNPDWGNYSKFSSTKSFGGISSTTINDIELLESSDNSAIIYADVYYQDNINGSNTFKQNFYVSKDIDNQWKITKMKIVKTKKNSNSKTNFPQKGVYSNGSLYLIIPDYKTGSDHFEGTLVNINNNEFFTGVDVHLQNGKWQTSDFGNSDCTLSLVFSNSKVTTKIENQCSINYSLSGTLTKINNKSYLQKGTYSYDNDLDYGDLEISNIARDKSSFTFLLTVVTTDGKCIGEVDSDFNNIAYGYNNVYIYTHEYCALMFLFTDKKVDIYEFGCELHGARCSFDAVYNLN